MQNRSGGTNVTAQDKFCHSLNTEETTLLNALPFERLDPQTSGIGFQAKAYPHQLNEEENFGKIITSWVVMLKHRITLQFLFDTRPTSVGSRQCCIIIIQYKPTKYTFSKLIL
jgi:hypothetical protein